jgi:ketosteroid isomerase-like protein
MSQENVEITRTALDAFNRGDLDRVARFHHPKIEWKTSTEDPYATTHHGRDAVRHYFRQWMESFAGLQAELDECFAVSDEVVFTTYHFSSQCVGRSIRAASSLPSRSMTGARLDAALRGPLRSSADA